MDHERLDLLPRVRTGEDDRPTTGVDDVLGRGHDRVPHTGDVDVDGRGEVLRRDRVPHLRDTDAGVGDHDVQAAEFGHPVVDDLLHTREVPDVTDGQQRASTLRLDQPPGLVEVLRCGGVIGHRVG